ncbi:MAG: TonB-dependent receptor [Opitutus sp.]|nr:TonB-dependent receptor [Opitutus sp.]
MNTISSATIRPCQWVAVIGVVLLQCASAFAQVRAVGTITGRVSNAATGAFLEGAEVSVETGASVLTSRDGSFSLNDMSPGGHVLRVHYTGLEVATKSADVLAGQTAQVSVALSSGVYQLEAFTVSADRAGNAASITKQRNADNVKNVVSMDAFGAVADGNIGNFLVRLPGVSADLDGGEVSSIGIRGTPPDVNTLSVDGARTGNATAGFLGLAGDRAPNIDQIPAEFIKEIEVSKAPRPEDPVDSIGGGVNLITKSALDFDRNLLSYRVGVNHNGHRSDLPQFTPNAAISYFTRLREKRDIGMALSLSYTDVISPRDRVDMQRVEPDGRNTQARTLADANRRLRVGAGVKFDYRLNERGTVYLKLQSNYFKFDRPNNPIRAAVSGGRRVADYSRVSRDQIEAGVVPRASDNQAAGVAPGFTHTFTELLNASWSQQVTDNTVETRTYVVELGGTIKMPADQKLIAQATFSPSRSSQDYSDLVATMGTGIGMTVDTRRDLRKPTFTQTYGPSIAYGSNFDLYTATYSVRPEKTEETVTGLKLDYVKDLFSPALPLQFKTGVNWREQYRWGGLRGAASNYRFVGADRVAGVNPATRLNDDNLRQFVRAAPNTPVEVMGHNPWPALDGIDIAAVNRAFASNPSWFLQTSFASQDQSKITEDVSAGYAQTRLQLGRVTSLLAGVRYERTDVEATANFTDLRKPGAAKITRQRDYDNYFPSVHLRHELRPGLVGRASYSTGMGRPRLTEMYPVTSVSYTAGGSGTVSQNDPGLRPQYSKNYDVAMEYYFEPAGVLSVGWFRKDITDYLFRGETDIGAGPNNGFNGDYDGFTLRTTLNAGKAKIEGLEFNYSQSLVMLPKPFNGLSIYANYTRLKSAGTFAEGVTELGGFVPQTINSGITYRWRKFLFRTAANYQSAYLRSRTSPSGAAAEADSWNYQWYRPLLRFDLNFQYSISERYALFFDVINVGDRWLTWFTGPNISYPSRVRIVDTYGRRMNLGISGRF